MLVNSAKKNKIDLSEYPFEKDLQSRQHLSELTAFEVDVLKEIAYGSLKTSVTQLAGHLQVNEQKLLPTLEKLLTLKLYTVEKGKIFVDKEMRKYYEANLPKFDDAFEPDLEFLKTLLSRVPIHVLPVWYAISRSSDDIFASIIEKHFFTPKTFQRYLDELNFEEKALNHIMKEVLNSPDCKVRAKDLITKYDLSRKQFEKGMLLLEFNLVCCLSYSQIDGHWEEVVTPFQEWREFLLFKKKNRPPTIESSQIERSHPRDFGFVEDMCSLLKEAIDQKGCIPEKTAKKVFSHSFSSDYLLKIIEMLEHLELIEREKKKEKNQVSTAFNLKEPLFPSETAAAWLKKPLQEQSMTLYCHESRQGAPSKASGTTIDRDLREIERSLKEVNGLGWIYFEDFLKGCTAPIGTHEPVALVRKGKRWRYQYPRYTEEETTILHRYLFETLFQAGIVATGTCQGKPCFCVTPFGRMAMD